jgi:hypothetical protein
MPSRERLIPAWTPGSESTRPKYVRALTASGSRIYAGGAFKVVDGISRTRLAAFDSAGNLDAAWKPRAAALVRSVAPSCDGVTIFAGGNFRSASGSTTALTTRTTLARFDASSGALHPWQIAAASIPNGVNAFDLAVTCGRLFVGYGGSNFAHAFDLTDNTGDVLWGLKTGGDVQTIAVYQNLVVFGGHFSQVSDISSGGNARRIRFAAADFDGHLDPWAPSFEGKFFGPWDILATATRSGSAGTSPPCRASRSR